MRQDDSSHGVGSIYFEEELQYEGLQQGCVSHSWMHSILDIWGGNYLALAHKAHTLKLLPPWKKGA